MMDALLWLLAGSEGWEMGWKQICKGQRVVFALLSFCPMAPAIRGSAKTQAFSRLAFYVLLGSWLLFH